MSTPAWMPFYVADYIADTGHLTTLEHGAYLLLIMHYWRSGGLPTDVQSLAAIARMPMTEWRRIEVKIAKLFEPSWRHKRIDRELAKSAAKAEARADSGRRGGIANSKRKASERVANATDLSEQNDTDALASSSQPQARNQEISISESARAFSEFWKKYPHDPERPISKDRSREAFAVLSLADQSAAVAGAPKLAAYCLSHPKYTRPSPVTFLVERRFEVYADQAAVAETTFFVKEDSPDWAALSARYAAERGKAPPIVNEGWHFPREWMAS